MLVRILVNAVALLAVFFLLWGVHGNDAIVQALVMAVLVTLINSFVRPIILLLTLPVHRDACEAGQCAEVYFGQHGRAWVTAGSVIARVARPRCAYRSLRARGR